MKRIHTNSISNLEYALLNTEFMTVFPKIVNCSIANIASTNKYLYSLFHGEISKIYGFMTADEPTKVIFLAECTQQQLNIIFYNLLYLGVDIYSVLGLYIQEYLQNTSSDIIIKRDTLLKYIRLVTICELSNTDIVRSKYDYYCVDWHRLERLTGKKIGKGNSYISHSSYKSEDNTFNKSTPLLKKKYICLPEFLDIHKSDTQTESNNDNKTISHFKLVQIIKHDIILSESIEKTINTIKEIQGNGYPVLTKNIGIILEKEYKINLLEELKKYYDDSNDVLFVYVNLVTNNDFILENFMSCCLGFTDVPNDNELQEYLVKNKNINCFEALYYVRMLFYNKYSNLINSTDINNVNIEQIVTTTISYINKIYNVEQSFFPKNSCSFGYASALTLGIMEIAFDNICYNYNDITIEYDWIAQYLRPVAVHLRFSTNSFIYSTCIGPDAFYKLYDNSIFITSMEMVFNRLSYVGIKKFIFGKTSLLYKNSRLKSSFDVSDYYVICAKHEDWLHIKQNFKYTISDIIEFFGKDKFEKPIDKSDIIPKQFYYTILKLYERFDNI
jgi:hypothetical protein